MDIRPIDANALLEKIRFREGPFAGQREIFLIEGEPTLSLNTLRDAIYEDAVAHGLWEWANQLDGYLPDVLFDCVGLIINEVSELEDEYKNLDRFTEELADVIIMSMSVAGKLGIDIDKAIRRKMEINKGRPWKHEGEKK